MHGGSSVTIRALKPGDRTEFLEAVRQCSSQSLYRRLFSPKQRFTEEEAAYFLNANFSNHVALIATLEEGGGASAAVEPVLSLHRPEEPRWPSSVSIPIRGGVSDWR